MKNFAYWGWRRPARETPTPAVEWPQQEEQSAAAPKPPSLALSVRKKPVDIFLFEDRKQEIFSGQSGKLLGFVTATDGDAKYRSLFEEDWCIFADHSDSRITRRALIRLEDWGEGDGRLVLVAEGAYVRDKSSTNDAHVDEDGDDE